MSKEMVDAYRESGEIFIARAKNLSPTQMNTSPSSGQWSPAYIVHHMADAEAFFTTRFMSILSDEMPDVVPFNEAVFPDTLHYALRSAHASLALIEGARMASAEILNSIEPAEWSRKGRHTALGEYSLHDAVAKATSHIQDHLAQIEETLKG